MWYGHKPDILKSRIFSVRAFSFVPKEKRNKLDSRSRSCHFVGYGVNGYRLWDGRRIFIARDVVVEELPLVSSRVEAQVPALEPSSISVELAGPSSVPSSFADPSAGTTDYFPVRTLSESTGGILQPLLVAVEDSSTQSSLPVSRQLELVDVNEEEFNNCQDEAELEGNEHPLALLSKSACSKPSSQDE